MSTLRHRAIAWTVPAGLAIAAVGEGTAQELRIRVAEPGRPTLVTGALVSLVGDDGRPEAVQVTDGSGRARFRVPAGSYRARIERPGFQDTTVAVTVRSGLDSLTISHGAGRPALPSRAAPIEANCQAGGVPDPVAPLWREVERMLRVVATTETGGLTTQSITGFERVLSSSLRRDSEQLNTILGPANRPPNAGTAGGVARAGYLTRDSGLVWAAPDVVLFGSSEFLATHCFGTSPPKEGREGLIGLRFEPVATGRVEIAGVMWLDPASRELKTIDYRFTGVPPAWRPDRLGGSVEFHRSEPGFWVTRFWYQRVPRIATDGRGERVVGYREDGAEITGLTATVDTSDRVAAAQAIIAQERAIRARVAVLAGTVVDTLGYPVAEAEVAVLGTDLVATSGRDGRFTMTGLPLGLQIIRVRKVGYRPQHFPIRLAAGQEWDGRIGIARLPQILGEIVVVGKYGKPAQYANTAKYDDFYRRRSTKGGRFLTREDIEKTAAGRISELLRTVPGVRVGFTQPGVSEDVSFLTCPSYNVGVWIDGQKVTGNVGEILPLITPSDVEAIEVYQRQSAVPPEFRDNSCAAIVMWTR
jgi:hypothetical protein